MSMHIWNAGIDLIIFPFLGPHNIIINAFHVGTWLRVGLNKVVYQWFVVTNHWGSNMNMWNEKCHHLARNSVCWHTLQACVCHLLPRQHEGRHCIVKGSMSCQQHLWPSCVSIPDIHCLWLSSAGTNVNVYQFDFSIKTSLETLFFVCDTFSSIRPNNYYRLIIPFWCNCTLDCVSMQRYGKAK